MNLYFRLIFILLLALKKPSGFSPFASVQVNFRVWPSDTDVNFHLTAARYLSFGDLGRVQWLACNGLLWRFFFRGYQAVLNAQEITYIREFKPLSRLTLEVQLRSWDEKYGYFEQRYYCKNKLHAVSHARVALLHKRKVVNFEQVFQRFGYVVNNQPETEAIKDWKATLQAKRDHFS